MRICLNAIIALWLVAAAAAAEPVTRVSSTVRADVRSGRLVRSTIVAPVHAAARQVPPRMEALSVAGSGVERAARRPPEIDEIVEEAARTYAVDPLLVHSVIQVESNYNPLAVSPKGAAGLMQLIPATARRFGVANSFDTRENITAGVRYLKFLQDTFKDDRLALAAYNAGEGAVQRYKNIPPYPETEQYVYKVGKRYGEALKRQQAAATAPLAAVPGQEPIAEPLRQLDIATDAEGRVILRTR